MLWQIFKLNYVHDYTFYEQVHSTFFFFLTPASLPRYYKREAVRADSRPQTCPSTSIRSGSTCKRNRIPPNQCHRGHEVMPSPNHVICRCQHNQPDVHNNTPVHGLHIYCRSQREEGEHKNRQEEGHCGKVDGHPEAAKGPASMGERLLSEALY